MKLSCLCILLTSASALSDDCNEDHDETLFLQTHAVAETVTIHHAVPVHRLHISLQEDGVSLIQKKLPQGADPVAAGAAAGAVVYQACATDNAGVEEETTDDLVGTTDTCSGMDITMAETGDYVGHVEGCAPSSVAEDQCFAFAASPDWFNSIGVHGLTSVQISPSSEDAEIFLIDVPAVDESQLSKAIDEIEKHVKDSSDPVVLFQGTGAKSVRSMFPPMAQYGQSVQAQKEEYELRQEKFRMQIMHRKASDELQQSRMQLQGRDRQLKFAQGRFQKCKRQLQKKSRQQ